MQQALKSALGKARSGVKLLPSLRDSKHWLKSREAEIRCLPRLRARLTDFFSLLQIDEPAVLARDFVAGLKKQDVRSAWNILSAQEKFFALLPPPRSKKRMTACAPPVVPVRPFRLLVISAMSPSRKHAGGLRLLDILTGLQSQCGYEIYLYAGSSIPKDEQAEPQEFCRGARFAGAEFGEKDLLAWLKSQLIAIGDFNAIQFEWGYCYHAFPSLYDAAPGKFFTHQESHLRRCSMELNQNGRAPALEQGWDYLHQISFNANLEALGFAKIQTHIVLTDEDSAFVRRFNPGRLEIIPTGLSQEFVAQPEFKGVVQENQLCFVGYFNHLPNREAMLWFLEKVWPLLKPVIKGLKLLVVGSGDVASLRARFADGVEFTGEVASVVPYIQQSEICIAPLISGAGFRGKVNQYAILGKPVVATSIAASGLAYKDEKNILIADSPENFAKALVRLLTDKKFSKSLGEAAKEIANTHYAWEPIIQRLDNVYRSGCVPDTVSRQ